MRFRKTKKNITGKNSIYTFISDMIEEVEIMKKKLKKNLSCARKMTRVLEKFTNFRIVKKDNSDTRIRGHCHVTGNKKNN